MNLPPVTSEAIPPRHNLVELLFDAAHVVQFDSLDMPQSMRGPIAGWLIQASRTGGYHGIYPEHAVKLAEAILAEYELKG